MPTGLIGALALILGVEWFIVRNKEVTMDASLWAYQDARRMATRKVEDCDVLAFGDSLIKHGVSPRVIREVAGLKGYNLALSGSQVPMSYILFRDALRSGARPRAVILDLFPYLLTIEPSTNSNPSLWPIVASYRDCLELGWRSGDAKFFGELMLNRLLPSLRCRESIRAELMHDFRGLHAVDWSNCRIALRNWEVNRGMGIENNRHDPNAPLVSQIGPYFQPIRCTSLNRLYIDRFMKLAEEHHVPVFLALPPYMPVVQARAEQVGFDAEHEAFVRSLVDRYPTLSVLDARRADYDPSAFIDTHHLSGEGAATFSADLGELIRQRLDRAGTTDRWVALPAFRWRSTAVKHEKLEESRLVVEERIRNRR
jgi:hypothetical protein